MTFAFSRPATTLLAGWLVLSAAVPAFAVNAFRNPGFEAAPPGEPPPAWFRGADAAIQEVTTAALESETPFFLDNPSLIPDAPEEAQMMRIGVEDAFNTPNDADLSQNVTFTAERMTFKVRLYARSPAVPATPSGSFLLSIVQGGTLASYPVSGFVVGEEVAFNGPFECDVTPCTVPLAAGAQNDFVEVTVSGLPVGQDATVIFSVRGRAWAYLDDVINDPDASGPQAVISFSPSAAILDGGDPLEGDPVFFDCNGSTGVALEDARCEWVVELGPNQFAELEGRVVAAAFPQDGPYDVSLRVTEADSPDSYETSVTVPVRNGAPLINALAVEVLAGGEAEALCRFADPGVFDQHTVTLLLPGFELLEPLQLREENEPSLSSGFAVQRFSADGVQPGTNATGTCLVDDGISVTSEQFNIRVVDEETIAAREGDDSDSALDAPVISAGREVLGSLSAPGDIDVFELVPDEEAPLRVGGEFVVSLEDLPTDIDLLLLSRNVSSEANASPFVSAPFVSAPFVSAPFVSVPFVSVPFVSAPFVSAPFVSVPFVSAPFVSVPFVSAPFVSAPITQSPFEFANYRFENFPLSQVGLAAPDGSNISGSDVGLDELGIGALAGQGLQLKALSAEGGKNPEKVLIRVGPGEEAIYAAVVSQGSSYDGAPYRLRVEASVPPTQEQVLGQACFRDPLVSNPSNIVTVLHDQNDPLTLIVTQRERVQANYDLNDAQYAAFLQAMQPFFDHPRVRARVISVPGDLYQEADQNQCRVALQNEVAEAVRAIVLAELASSNMRYVQFLGGADIIPPYYTPDEAIVGYEGFYVQDLLLQPARPIGVGFAEGYNITDAFYTDFEPSPYRGRFLYVEDLSVSRLLESPEEILAAAQTFVANNGLIPVSDALAVGYDFFQDGTRASAAVLGRFTTVNESLINDGWTGDELRCSFLDNAENKVAACPVIPSAPALGAVNFHATYNAGISAFGYNNFGPDTNPGEIFEARENDMVLGGGLTVSIGCHSGLNIPDAWALPGDVGFPLDPAADWVQQAGNWIGPWNFGLGDDTVATRGTEGIATLVFEQLLEPEDEQRAYAPKTLGDALVKAKQLYASGLVEFDVHDEKSVIGLALAGMPQARLALTSAPPPAPVGPLPGTPAGSLDVTFTDSNGASLPSPTLPYNVVTTDNGTYYPLEGRAQGVVGRPLLPSAPLIDGQVVALQDLIHDVVLRSGSYDDELDINPILAFPQHDWLDNVQEPRACVETFAPSQLGVATAFPLGGPNAGSALQSVLLLGAQFRCTLTDGEQADPAEPVRGTLRRYDALTVEAQRPATVAVADDFDPPVVTLLELVEEVTGDVTARLNADDLNGLREIVAVIYEDGDGVPGGPGTLRSVSSGDLTGVAGPYTLTLPGAGGNPVAFQFVDTAGNVRLKSGKGRLLRALPGIDDLAARGRLTTVTLTWTDVDATSYNVYRSTAAGPFEFIGATTSTYSLFTDPGLTLGTTYCYEVTSVGATGEESTRSNQACVTPRGRARRR